MFVDREQELAFLDGILTRQHPSIFVSLRPTTTRLPSNRIG
jgi:hypothetical protein